ncbi:MAG: alpha/beta hydrolase domain-containing protein [Caulobacteraceae bacterium]
MNREIDPHRRALMAGVAAVAAGSSTRALAAQVAASLEGPIPGGPVFTGGRAGEADAAMKRHGYVQEEYFLTGAVDGRPYKVPLLVRRPADDRKFSGLVVVEPVHVGGASELWPKGGEVFMAGGHGFALAGAQRIPLDATIRPVNPTRYASLVMPQATAAEIAAVPLAGVLASAPQPLAGQLRASVAEGPLTHEIISQVGALLKSPAGRRVFRKPARWLVTGGYSQTGGLTLNYIRGAAQTARTADGKPIYDGFMALGSSGETPLPRHPGKVLQALGEGDYISYAATRGDAYRRPDSDAPGDQYRLYEIAGGSHVSTRGAALTPEARANFGPDEHPGQFPSLMIYQALIANLLAWVAKGTPPPHAERLKLNPDKSVARDAHGNALGGVRSSYLDVPVARYIAVAPPREGSFNRNFFGVEVPLPKETLARLYPTHGDYVAKVKTSVDGLVRARSLLPADGETLKREAETATIP